jgi:hypothetical protein
MELLTTSTARLCGLDDALRDDLDELHNVFMALNSLKSNRIIHENSFLIQIGFVLLVEVWTLNHFERLIFHILLILKVND